MNYFNNKQDLNKIRLLFLGFGLFLTLITTRLVAYEKPYAANSVLMLDTLIVDFDNGDYAAGDIVSELNVGGIEVGVFGYNPKFPEQNAAMIFDSGNPTGGDLDLGTPNQVFGGPGINLAGGPVLSNDVPLNNVLIVSEDLNSEEPDDASAHEISITFEFSSAVRFISMDLLDVDSGEAELMLSDSTGKVIHTQVIPETGCNGVAHLKLSVDGVSTMHIALNGSGAIDNIRFIVDDGMGSSGGPTANDDIYQTLKDSTLVVDAPGVLQNDTDEDGDELNIIAYDTTTTAGGTVSLDEDGGFSYSPPDGFEGDDTFTYVVSDEENFTDTATVTIRVVEELNLAPDAADDEYSIEVNTELVVEAPGVLGNDTDAEGDPLTATLVDSSSIIGTLVVNPDGSFNYTPVADSAYIDTFTYMVSDGQGNSDTARVFIDVFDFGEEEEEEEEENSPPIAQDDMLMTDQDLELLILDPAQGVLANDWDPDGDSIVAVVVSDVITDQGGRISINSDGTLTYVPGLGFVGTDTYQYTVCDDQDPSLCSNATIYIEVEELPVKVFDAFSPNGDGINDTWIIQGITRFPNNEVQIFNRWGNLVFQATGYNNTTKVWSGQSSEGLVFGSNDAPDGAYFYIITLGDGSEKISGYVVVRR